MGNKQSTAKQKESAPKNRSSGSKTNELEKKDDRKKAENIQLEEKERTKGDDKVEQNGDKKEASGAFARNGSGRRSSGRAKASLRKRGILEISYEDYSYPFENLIFEGGGATCLAYCGAIRILEEVGILTRIRRFAGSNFGALTAALVAVGFNSYQLETFIGLDIKKLLFDRCCGKCSLCPNLSGGFGWNPGDKLYKWLGRKLKDATRNADITFMEIYKMFGKELCVVVTNLSQMNVEYCHPKTTPDMPIRLAIKMSMATPGLYKPVKYKNGEREDLYVDGGILCSYPVHCFDGWWLSMKPGDTFLQHLNPLSELALMCDKEVRFQGLNDKTLGFFIYSEKDQDVFQNILEQRNVYSDPKHIPSTKLSKSNTIDNIRRREPMDRHAELAKAVNKLIQALQENNLLERNKDVTRAELQGILTKGDILTENDLKTLFGEKIAASNVFVQLGAAQNEKISLSDLISYLDKKGLSEQARYLSARRKEIKSLDNYFMALKEGMAVNTRASNVLKRDMDRTAGINTHYIEENFFDLEREDRLFLVDQGKRAARGYLEFYVSKKVPPILEGRRAYVKDDPSYFIDDEMSEIIDIRDYSEGFLGRVL